MVSSKKLVRAKHVNWSLRDLAEWQSLESLLSCYARDFQVGALRDRLPHHDPALAARLGAQLGSGQWLRLPFDAAGVDAFCPLTHWSASGRHRLAPGVVVRDRATGTLRALDRAHDALELVERAYDALAPGARSSRRVRARLANSRDNLLAILEHRVGKGFRSLDELGFLAAEQALVTGHGAHPLAKSRWGFSPDDVRRYAPELGGGFQLSYLLAHPELVLGDHVRGPGFERLVDDVCEHPHTPAATRTLLARHPDWSLIPLHPWEAEWLRTRRELGEAGAHGQLRWLGTLGGEWFATSSVRTVYRADLPFQLKLSLHVAVTNSQRTNHLHELQRGCEVARLLDSPWGQALAADFPALGFLRDEGFRALTWRGAFVDGTGVQLRANAFAPDARVTLVAALCEPALVGPTLLCTAVARTAVARGLPLATAAAVWFDHYLELLLDNVLGAYERHGLALEIHQQNLLVELDDAGLPARLFFRDNQGYFFRAGKAAEVLGHAPGLATAGTCILPEAALHGPFAYYLMVNNVLGVVEALSSQQLCAEAHALELLRLRLAARLPGDTTGLVRELLSARGWPAKANLRMALEDRDEACRPVEAPATYVELANPLLAHEGPGLRHPCPCLVRPEHGYPLYQRHFDEHAPPIELRAFDLERDLALVHDWVNQDYARRYWNMEGPIRDLESFYLELLASGHASALVGERAGRAAFVLETYWAPRDAIGRYYDVRPGDYGFHVLACPPAERSSGFTRQIFQVALEYCFVHAEVERIVGEPDARNRAVDRLIRSVGYQVERVVEMPEKPASLAFCTRASFLGACPDSRPFVSPAGGELARVASHRLPEVRG